MAAPLVAGPRLAAQKPGLTTSRGVLHFYIVESGKQEWFTMRELAEWLRVPYRTVESWNYHGTGPPRHRFGRQVRYRARDVEAWLRTRQVAS